MPASMRGTEIKGRCARAEWRALGLGPGKSKELKAQDSVSPQLLTAPCHGYNFNPPTPPLAPCTATEEAENTQALCCKINEGVKLLN